MLIHGGIYRLYEISTTLITLQVWPGLPVKSKRPKRATVCTVDTSVNLPPLKPSDKMSLQARSAYTTDASVERPENSGWLQKRTALAITARTRCVGMASS